MDGNKDDYMMEEIREYLNEMIPCQSAPAEARSFVLHRELWRLGADDDIRVSMETVPSAAREDGRPFHDGISFGYMQVTQLTSTVRWALLGVVVSKRQRYLGG